MAWRDFFLQLSCEWRLVLFPVGPFGMAAWRMSSWPCESYKRKNILHSSPFDICRTSFVQLGLPLGCGGRIIMEAFTEEAPSSHVGLQQAGTLPAIKIPLAWVVAIALCIFLFNLKMFIITWAMCRRLGWIRLELPHVPHLHINVFFTAHVSPFMTLI